MEWTDAAAVRAAGEWGPAPRVQTPIDLIEFYRRHGAQYFADLGAGEADHSRKGLHDSIRRRYKVVVDRADVIIADLANAEMRGNAN
jgi:hypothetical protein